jgi:hypothetical protein
MLDEPRTSRTERSLTMSSTSSIAAQDGIDHAPSTQPAVHRPLVVVDPPMEGRDVANLQRAIRDRLKARDLTDDVPVPEHGKFTLATELACIEAQYFLGLRSDTYMQRDPHGHRVVTEGAQRVIREPETRDADQLARAKERQAQAARGPRFFREISDIAAGHGIADALAFAAAHVGLKETSDNRGPEIDKWIRATGLNPPQPWCGCFVNACLMAGGLPSSGTWIASTIQILHHAKQGIGGWSFHMEGKPGDLSLYHESGNSDEVAHVEIVRARTAPTMYSTYGGNTTMGNDARALFVARHDNRSTQGGFHIVGFARPPWKA